MPSTTQVPTVYATRMPDEQVTATPEAPALWHIDLFAGTSSSLRYHLGADLTCHVLAVDKMAYETALEYIPEQYRARFHYWQENIQNVTYSSLASTLNDVGGSMERVRSVHGSPSCKTVSVAHHGNSPHRIGDWRSDEAIADDNVLEHTCALMHVIGTEHPTILQSLENPLCMFADMPAVQRLSKQHGWQMVREMHHCMMTSELDDRHFPQKPTTWLLMNCAPQSDVLCYNRCSNRLKDRNALSFHKVLVCNRADKHPDQIVMTDDLEKSRIPLGLFAHLQVLHQQERACVDHPDDSPSAEPDITEPMPPDPTPDLVPPI